MKKLVIAATLALSLSACGFDPVREAVNYKLGDNKIGEAMLAYKAMGKIKINNQKENGTVSVVGTIDNKSYVAEFPTSQLAEMMSNPNNSMQVIFYLNYATDQQEKGLKFDHCAIILKENGEETRITKQDAPGKRECTRLLQELNTSDSLI